MIVLLKIGANVQVSGQNPFTFQVIYHLGQFLRASSRLRVSLY